MNSTVFGFEPFRAEIESLGEQEFWRRKRRRKRGEGAESRTKRNFV